VGFDDRMRYGADRPHSAKGIAVRSSGEETANSITADHLKSWESVNRGNSLPRRPTGILHRALELLGETIKAADTPASPFGAGSKGMAFVRWRGLAWRAA
jgi:hypothetical protein